MALLGHDAIISLFAHAFTGIPAPPDAGYGVVEDLEAAGAALYRDIVGEDLDFRTALRALLDGQGGGAQVRRSGTVIEHDLVWKCLQAER